MRADDTLLCTRRKHILAQLFSDGGLRVEAHEIVGYDAVTTTVYRPDSLDSETSSLAIVVGCACKKQYVIDLAAPFRERRFGRAMTFQTPRVSDDT